MMWAYIRACAGRHCAIGMSVLSHIHQLTCLSYTLTRASIITINALHV